MTVESMDPGHRDERFRKLSIMDREVRRTRWFSLESQSTHLPRGPQRFEGHAAGEDVTHKPFLVRFRAEPRGLWERLLRWIETPYRRTRRSQ